MSKYSGVIQSDRIFKIAGEWYFNTREGVEGPYENRLQAKNKLDVYLGIFGNLELTDRSTPIRSAMPIQFTVARFSNAHATRAINCMAMVVSSVPISRGAIERT